MKKMYLKFTNYLKIDTTQNYLNTTLTCLILNFRINFFFKQ